MAITITSRLDMTALRAAIAEVLGFPKTSVREDYQPTDTGKNAFLTVGIFTSDEIGQSTRFDGAEEAQYVTTTHETTVQVNAFGKGAINAIYSLNAATGTDFFRSHLKRMGAGLVRTSNVRNLSMSIGGGYEERGQIELTLSHNHTVKVSLLRADTVDINLHKGH